MPLRSEDALQIVLGVLVISGFASSLNCPQNHYPFTCATCFTIPEDVLDFNSSLAFCQIANGTLITVENSSQMLTLGRYLEGLNDTRTLWTGYRYVMGSRVDVAGQAAPEVLQDSGNFISGTTTGDTDTCIGVQEGRFVNVPCSERRPFICLFQYSVPALVSSSERIVYAAPAESVTLTARFQGVGISAVEWRHNGTELRPQNGIVTTVDGGFTQQTNLTILQFNSSADSGQYEIVVENPVGLAILAVLEIQPAVIGNFAAMPENLTIPRGQVAFFRCSVEGAQPRPLITWYKDSATLNTEGTRFHVSDVTGTLFIRDVLESDAGLYHCTASNGAGTIRSAQAVLTLTAPPQFDPQQQVQLPQILLQPNDMTILRGNPYSLECVGLPTGGNTSQITFLNNRNLAQGALRSFLYPDPPMGFPIYRIESVSFSDQSDCYYCQIRDATTRISFETRKATLTVHSQAQVDTISTTINSVRLANSLQLIPLGSNLTLQCQFGGVPIPSTVTWTVDGNTTTMEGVRIAANTSTLEVTDFQGTGIYQCHVNNLYGTASGGVTLCGTDTGRVPGAVLFRAEPDTNTSIFIEWTEPSDPNTHPLLLRYQVFLVNLPLRREESFGPFPAYQKDSVVTGLEPGMVYAVSVVASSLDGQGELPAVNVTVTTFANPTTTLLTDITVQQTSDNSALLLTWRLFNVSVGTVIRGYEIQYRNVNSSNITTMFVDMGEQLFIVSGLNNSASYEARIRVVFQIQRAPPAYAPGPWSEWQLAQGITTSPPNTTLTPSQVTLTPSSPPTGGVIGGTGTRTPGLLLVILLLPVVLLSIIVIVVVIVIIVSQYRKHQKPRGSYSPSKVERRSMRARPMGSQVFNLPFGSQVADALPLNSEATDTLPFSGEVAETGPFSGELADTLPFSGEVAETKPFSGDLADTLPFSGEVAETGPFSGDLADTLPFSGGKLAQTGPFSGDLADTLPFSGGELAQTGPFSGEVAQTGPFSGELAKTGPFSSDFADTLPFSGKVAETLPLSRQLTNSQAFGSQADDILPFRSYVADTLPYRTQITNTPPFSNQVADTLPFSGQFLPFRNQAASNKAFGQQLMSMTPDPYVQPMCSQTHFGSQDTDIQAFGNLVAAEPSFEVFPSNPYLQQTMLMDGSQEELNASYHKPYSS